MDSVSQMALGAALGHAVLGRHLGRAAIPLGAALGTLPDLDVLVRYADAVDSFTEHRSWSHSLFVLTAASPVIAWPLQRLTPPLLARVTAWRARRERRRLSEDRGGGSPAAAQVTTDMSAARNRGDADAGLARADTAANRMPADDASAGATAADTATPGDASYRRWLLAVWLILFTHPLLDAFTVYGTQIWWPLPGARPVALGSVFIIDPLYTLPLLVGLVIAWRSRGRIGRVANGAGLALATAYLGWTLVAQQGVRERVERALATREIDASRVLVVPFPLSLLWRVVALDGDVYHEGYASLLDDGDDVRFVAMPRGNALLDAAADYPSVARLDWFTDALIAAEARDDALVVSDLRMGIEASYVFEFTVAERDGDGWRPVVSRLEPIAVSFPRLRQIVARTWDETVEIDRGGRRTGNGGDR